VRKIWTFRMKTAFQVSLEDLIYERFVFKSPLAHHRDS